MSELAEISSMRQDLNETRQNLVQTLASLLTRGEKLEQISENSRQLAIDSAKFLSQLRPSKFKQLFYGILKFITCNCICVDMVEVFVDDERNIE